MSGPRIANVRRWRAGDALAASPHDLAEVGHVTLAGQLESSLEESAKPEVLFERWEKQRWSAAEIDLNPDRAAWKSQVSPALKAQIGRVIERFLIGEYTAVDHVSPAMFGAPDEQYLSYLATQSSDEAQHWRFMNRLAEEVLNVELEPRLLLAKAWQDTTPAMRELVSFESELTRQLAASPASYEIWLRLITVFHLLTEGVIATTGQRMMLRAMSRRADFPGLVAGFSAFARDEGRHVGFGLHALREGIERGGGEAIWDAIERIAPTATLVDVEPESGRVGRILGRRSAAAMRMMLERRLAGLGASESFVVHVRSRCEEALVATEGLDSGEVVR